MSTEIERLVDSVIAEIERNKSQRGEKPQAKGKKMEFQKPEPKAEQDIKQQFAKFAAIDLREFFAHDFAGVAPAMEKRLEDAERSYFAAVQLAHREPQLTSAYQEINSSGYLSPAAKTRLCTLLNGLFWSEVRNRLLAARSTIEKVTEGAKLIIENPPKPALAADKASAAALIRAEIVEDVAHAIGEAAPFGIAAVRAVFAPRLVSAFESPDSDMPAAIIRAARRSLGTSLEGRKILQGIERDYTANLEAYSERTESTATRQAKAALKAAVVIFRGGEHDQFLLNVLGKASTTKYNGFNAAENNYTVERSPVFMRG